MPFEVTRLTRGDCFHFYLFFFSTCYSVLPVLFNGSAVPAEIIKFASPDPGIQL